MKNNKEDTLLEYIIKYQLENGYPPTVREMCHAIKVSSTSTVSYYLLKLEEHGLIRKSPNKNRALEIVSKDIDKPSANNDVIDKLNNLTKIPVVGKITAGIPIMAVESCEDYLMVSPSLFRGEDLFVLNVSGESMINAGIYNGDKIILHQQSTANNGEIVAAMIDGCATVKRFYREGGHFRLQPENDLMSPIIVQNVEILGKVIGLIRKF